MATAAAPAPPPPPQAQAQQQQPPIDQQQKALAVNSIRLKAIGDRIRTHLRGMSVLPLAEFAHLVYAFARGIDFAVSASDIPPMAGDIPGILRKVFELRKETYIQSSLMVLVISCKNACSNNWFQPSDSGDILRMANELSGNFCTSSGQAASDSTVLQIISQIMPRYYPHLKFERLITSIEAKVGYDILMADFFIERNLSRDEKIRLIVVEKENLDTSSCVTSPQHVSFLVNGKGVEKRTNVSMDVGPQFPTDITKMLKYGANIIQAVGYFNANYVIAVAFVNNLTSFSAPKLDDYAQPITVPADSDVLEGPSRISLNCPISLKRIKTPIKGRLCKHYQCFDYDNYMEMNSRKPNWRCPYCNTPSNFTDLRIDQKMTKILDETGDDVIDVLVFADGSWKAAPAHDEKSDRHRGDAIQQTGEAIETDLSSSGVIDLINSNGDDDKPMDWASALEDTKPLLNSQDLSVSDYLPDFPMAVQAEDLYLGDGNNGGSNTTFTSRQNSSLPSASGLGVSSLGTLESILPQNVLRPVITDAVSPSLESSSSTSSVQHISQETHRETVHLQPQIGPVHGSEVRRLPIPRDPRREPVGVQALPVPPQNPVSSTRLQPNILNCPPPIQLSTPASSTYQAHQVMNLDCVIAPVNNGSGPLPRTPSAATSHLQAAPRDMRNTSNHLPSRVVSLPASHLTGARPPPGISGQVGGGNTYRPTPMQQTTTLDQLRHTRMTMNQTTLAAAGQTTAAAHVRPIQADIQNHILPTQQSQAPRLQSVPRASAHLQPASVLPAATSTPHAATPPSLQRAPPHLQPLSVPSAALGTPHASTPSLQRAPPHLQTPNVPSAAPSTPHAATPSLQRAPPHLQTPSVPTAAPSTPQAGSSDGFSPELPVDENWCPTGRMRGSLTGNAYDSALRRYQQAAHPPSASGARRPH